MSQPTRVLILGGGFGGVYTALTLEKLLRAEIRRGEVELGLVSRENYIVFQPMLPEVISGSIGVLDVITPIRRLCPSTNLYTRTIESIDLQHRSVQSTAGFGSRQHHLHFDHLVVALGTVTSFAGQPGLAEYALPFKYLGDALALRNRLIHTLEEADIEQDPSVRRALLTFVVAGGGFSGVEAVAELNDFVRVAARSFRRVRPEEIRVVLLHAGGLILPELPKSLAEFAQSLLTKRGVEIRLNTRLAGATADTALLEGGGRLETRTLVSTVPSAPNPLVAMLPVKKERGRIVVDAHLEVADYPGLWAVGDCAGDPRHQDRRGLPADRPARHAPGRLRRPQHRGRREGHVAEDVRVHRARQDGLAGPPLGGGGDLRDQAVRLPGLVAVADDLPDEASGARPEDPRGDGLDARPGPAARHRAAQDRPRSGRATRVLRARPGDIP
jgi:NADH:quinone reductase (non-electrogenic)